MDVKEEIYRLQKRVNEYHQKVERILGYTKGVLWFETPNPLLGGITPLDMIKMGRHEKLFKFIDNQIAEGGWEKDDAKHND